MNTYRFILKKASLNWKFLLVRKKDQRRKLVRLNKNGNNYSVNQNQPNIHINLIIWRILSQGEERLPWGTKARKQHPSPREGVRLDGLENPEKEEQETLAEITELAELVWLRESELNVHLSKDWKGLKEVLSKAPKENSQKSLPERGSWPGGNWKRKGSFPD